MEHVHHGYHDDHPHDQHIHDHGQAESLNQTAIMATLHCLMGCAIGEVAGMAIGTALGWSNTQTVVLAIGLAFLSGFMLTAFPFLRRGFGVAASVRIALAADTASIAVMEIVDNGLMMLIPGAMDATLGSLLFWGSMVVSLAVAGAAAFPLNRWLIAKGRGHAVVHEY